MHPPPAEHPVAWPPRPPTAATVHARYGKFVWKTLRRMGIRSPHLEDVYQEVFLVVHRRIDSFEGNGALTTWLFGVCCRVVAGYRRRAYFRREYLVADIGTTAAAMALTARSPERELERHQANQRLDDILNELKRDQRAVFCMFELDGMTCVEISALANIPVGTVYSRLHRARRAFLLALARPRQRRVRAEA